MENSEKINKEIDYFNRQFDFVENIITKWRVEKNVSEHQINCLCLYIDSLFEIVAR